MTRVWDRWRAWTNERGEWMSVWNGDKKCDQFRVNQIGHKWAPPIVSDFFRIFTAIIQLWRAVVGLRPPARVMETPCIMSANITCLR